MKKVKKVKKMRNTKIKIICRSSAVRLEHEVNDFLETHEVIDIQYKPVVIVTAAHADINDRVMIVYVDDGD